MQYEISHTFCDLWTLPDCLKSAILSERRFLPKEKINAFYNPPRSQEIYDIINPIANVIEAPLITRPHSTLEGGLYQYYGEKIHYSSLNSPNILYMDCDTLTIHNPEIVFDDDFDIAVPTPSPTMQMILKDPVSQKRWEKLFKRYDKKVGKWLCAPVAFLKDNIAKEIRDEYLFYMEEDLSLTHNFYNKDEICLSLVMADKKCKYLSSDVIDDWRYRKYPFYSNIKDWEKEPSPLIWHIGYKGMSVTQFK